MLAVSGRSGSGKTTLIVGLLSELTRRGYEVATIKHCPEHEPVDVPGKDTDRHLKAGAAAAMLKGVEAAKVFFRSGGSERLEDVAAKWLGWADLILLEGFKSLDVPRIEVARAALGKSLLCAESPGLLAVVADFETGAGVPEFGHGDIAAIADFVAGRFLADRESRRPHGKR